MKAIQKISQQKRITVLLVGLLVAIFTLLSGYAPSYDTDASKNAEVAEDGSGNEEQSKSQTSISSFDAVTHVLQINLPDFDDVINLDYPVEKQASEDGSSFPEKSTSKFFKTLFRYIISPNAP